MQPVSHPFLDQPSKINSIPYLIAYQGGSSERPANTLLAFEHSASLHENIILWADVRPTLDQVLVVIDSQDLALTTNGSGWVGYTAYEDLSHLDAGYRFEDSQGQFPYRGQGLRIPTLKEVLQRFPERKFVLNFRDYKPGLDQRIIELIDELRAGHRVLIQSEENGLLKDLREKKPEWIFGTSQAQITQMRMLTSLGLESMTPLKGDVYITEIARGRTSLLSDQTITEVQRRQIKIFAGPVESPDQGETLINKGVEGIITDRPSAFLNQAEQ